MRELVIKMKEIGELIFRIKEMGELIFKIMKMGRQAFSNTDTVKIYFFLP
jgi:hypothetical protein